jgi:iron complex transport system substrate-binding protein
MAMTRVGAMLALAGLLALPGPTAMAAVRVVDDTGLALEMQAPATRIVSLAPHATELLFAIGAGLRIVGTIDTSDTPPAARLIPRIGDSRALDLERILALHPDLIVTWPWAAPAQVAALRARGFAVFTTNPESMDGIATDLERLGALTGNAVRAGEEAAAFRRRLANLRAQYAGAPRVRVFYEIWDAPLYTVGGRHLISQAIRVCGGENVFAALTLPAPSVGIESVLAQRPDAIIAGADRAVRPAWLDAWRRWTDLPAVAGDHLFVVDADLLHRPGPRFLEGVAELCAAIGAAR